MDIGGILMVNGKPLIWHTATHPMDMGVCGQCQKPGKDFGKFLTLLFRESDYGYMWGMIWYNTCTRPILDLEIVINNHSKIIIVIH